MRGSMLRYGSTVTTITSGRLATLFALVTVNSKVSTPLCAIAGAANVTVTLFAPLSVIVGPPVCCQ